jgi:hypothetical protein
VAAYQTERAGITRHQWWLAPLNWHFVAGYPARQITVGVLAVVLFVLALVWLASRTWRYEAVRPPYNVDVPRKEKARWITAATLPKGLADDEFWDGGRSVRLFTSLHVAAAGGFLAIALGVTAKALVPSPHAIALAWIAIGLGAATVAAGAGYVCLDALVTKAADPEADGRAARQRPDAQGRPLAHPDARFRDAQHLDARSGVLGGAPDRPGIQRRGHGRLPPSDLPALRDHLGGAADRVGGCGGHRGVRGGRGVALVADPAAVRG